MAFLLRKDGPVNDTARVIFPAVTFTNSGELDFSTDWEIEIDIAVTGTDLPFLSDDFDSSKLLFFRAGNRLEFRSSKFSTVQITFAQNYSDRHKYRIVSNPALSRIEVYQDDVLGGTISGNSLDSYDTIFNFGNSSRFGDLFALKFYKNGVIERDYTKQILVGGNDTEYTEQVNLEHGTLIDFPTDNSQWVFYNEPSAGVTADVTESSSDFSESSSISFAANISAQVTEINTSFSESSSTTITNNLITLSVTEISQDFSESVSTSISGSLSAIVTELSQLFTESSIADISANISAAVTELAQDFNESAQVNLIGSFTVEVTETTSDFEEACYIQLPVQRLIPRKVISVNNRSGSTIRVRRRSSVIRVR